MMSMMSTIAMQTMNHPQDTDAGYMGHSLWRNLQTQMGLKYKG